MAGRNENDRPDSDEVRGARIRAWFEDYGSALRRYFRRHQCRSDEVDDLLHDVFVVALQKSEDYREQGYARAYLYRIARNLLLASRRKQNRTRQQPVEEIEDPQPPTIGGSSEQGEQRDALWQSLDKIRREQRVVIQLRLEQEMSFKEIANLLDVSLNTAISHFHRGITRLRKTARRGTGSSDT